MTLFLFATLNLIVLFLFLRMKKRLHVLEIILYWLIASYLFQNYSALFYMNFKTLVIPEKLSYEFSHFLNRILLYPVVMVTFLQVYLTSKSYITKTLTVTSYILLLGIVEWIEHLTDVLIHKNWHLWWSLAFWTISLLLLIGVMSIFRKMLFKGAHHL